MLAVLAVSVGPVGESANQANATYNACCCGCLLVLAPSFSVVAGALLLRAVSAALQVFSRSRQPHPALTTSPRGELTIKSIIGSA